MPKSLRKRFGFFLARNLLFCSFSLSLLNVCRFQSTAPNSPLERFSELEICQTKNRILKSIQLDIHRIESIHYSAREKKKKVFKIPTFARLRHLISGWKANLKKILSFFQSMCVHNKNKVWTERIVRVGFSFDLIVSQIPATRSN